MYQNLGLKGLLIVGLLVVSIMVVFPLQERISLGLDLKGGMHLVYKVDTSQLSKEASIPIWKL